MSSSLSWRAFRAVAASAVDLAVPPEPQPVPGAEDEARLPPSGRLMVSRLLRLAVQGPGLGQACSLAKIL